MPSKEVTDKTLWQLAQRRDALSSDLAAANAKPSRRARDSEAAVFSSSDPSDAIATLRLGDATAVVRTAAAAAAAVVVGAAAVVAVDATVGARSGTVRGTHWRPIDCKI